MCCVLLNIMKVNLLFSYSILFSSIVCCVCSLVSLLMMSSRLNFIISRMVMLVVIIVGLVMMWFRLIFMFMVMKNRFSSSFLNGLICDFSLCWNFELDSSMLVRKVFRLGFSLVFCMNYVVFSMISSVIVVNIFGLCVCVMMLNSWCSIGCLYRIIIVSVLSVMVMLFYCRVLLCVLLSSGMVVSSGMVMRFWNSRIVKFRWL